MERNHSKALIDIVYEIISLRKPMHNIISNVHTLLVMNCFWFAISIIYVSLLTYIRFWMHCLCKRKIRRHLTMRFSMIFDKKNLV